MSSRMRVTKGHTRNRRSHHGIDAPRLSQCSNCSEYHLRHRVCQDCGHYKGRAVLANKTEGTVTTASETTK